MTRGKLPLGIQNFEELRKGGYLYADKTDMVWQIANGDKYNFLSRPRRFGKSLLVSTLQCYFEGKKELFEGLKIMELEKDWIKRPVIHFSMNLGGSDAESLYHYLDDTLTKYEEIYGKRATEATLSNRFTGIIERAYQQSGEQVAVLVDESVRLPDYQGRNWRSLQTGISKQRSKRIPTTTLMLMLPARRHESAWLWYSTKKIED